MDHKFVRRVHEPAVQALDAGSAGVGVQLRHEESLALPEALVVHLEAPLGELQLDGAGELLLAVGRVGAPVEQGVAEPLGVRLGDEPAGGGREGQDAHDFQDLQLVGRAPGAVDVQLVAHRVDLLQGEVPEHGVQDLGQAEPLLPAHHEAGDGLPFQDGLAPLRGPVRRHEEGARHDGRGLDGGQVEDGLRRVFAIVLLVHLLRPAGGEGGRATQGAHGAQMKLFQGLLQPGMRLEAASTDSLHLSAPRRPDRTPERKTEKPRVRLH